MEFNKGFKAGLGVLAGVAMVATCVTAAPAVYANDSNTGNTPAAPALEGGVAEQSAPADNSAPANTTTAPQSADAQSAAPAAPEAQASAANKSVASVDGQGYETLQKAVDNAKPGDTVTLTADSAEKVDITKKLTITANTGISFTGSLIFKKVAKSSAEGSKVQGLTFDRPEPTQADIDAAAKPDSRWIVNPIEVKSVSDITVTGNTFNSPSALFKGREWQYNGVWVDYGSSSITISKNVFNLGRLNDTNGKGENADDANANSAINLVGKGPKNIVIDSNTVNVTAPDKSATFINATINLLIAMGNSNNATGISNVTVSNNTYNGANDKEANTQFVGLSDVHNITFTGNTVSDAKYGIGQSVWNDNTNLNTGVTLGSGNTFKNVANSFNAQTDQKNQAYIGAAVAYAADSSYIEYGWIQDAVDAVNESEGGATLYLLKSVDSHKQYTFKKKVEVTVPFKYKGEINFNGSMRFNASESKVSGIDFVIDNNDLVFKNGKLQPGAVQQNVIVSNHANGVEVTGNTFTIASVNKGNVDFQPSSVWLEQGVSNTNIHGNTFNLGRAYNNSAVGINFVGGPKTNTIKDTKVDNNTVHFTADAKDYPKDYGENSISGSAMFVIANGNTKGEHGVQGIQATGNTIDGSNGPKVKDYAVAISDVSDITLTGNTVSHVQNALTYSNYNGTSPSTGLKINKNTLEDNTSDVDFDLFFNAGSMTIKDINYGGGDNANVIKRTGYKATPAHVSGLAFAGWYEQNGKTPANNKSKTSYAKLVPVAEAYTFDFLGGSLRADKDQPANTANLRFGYRTKLGSDLKLDSAGWSYTIPGSGNFDGVSGDAQSKNYYDKDGYRVSNLVVMGIPSTLYATNIRVRMYLTYVTLDGTKVTVNDANENTRSVNDIAKAITADDSATADAKHYAQNLLEADQALQ